MNIAAVQLLVSADTSGFQPGSISVGKKGSPTCRRSPGCFRPKNPRLSADAASFDRGGHLQLPLRRKAPASWP